MVLLIAQSAFAQLDNPAIESELLKLASPVLSHDAEGHVIIRASRIVQSVRIDGQLDDAAYREIPSITEFIQSEPVEGAPATERTEVWILFDDKNIYITCRSW